MGLLNTAISNLLGGVTQQADSLQVSSRCREQVNAYPSPVEGLVKRQATEFVGIIDAYEPETSHLIDRDISEKYIVSVTSRVNDATLDDEGFLKVWDVVNNEEKVVYYDTDAKDYLLSDDPLNDFKFTTAGDVTFISNASIVPEMLDAYSASQENNGIVHVRQGAYDTDYNIKLDGVTITHETGRDGDNEAKTTVIAQGLYDGLMTGTTTSLFTDSIVPIDSGITESPEDWLGEHPMRIAVNFSPSSTITSVVGNLFRFTSQGTGARLTYRTGRRGGMTGGAWYITTNANYRIHKTDSETNPTWVEIKTLSNQRMFLAGKYRAEGNASVVMEDNQGSTSFGTFSFDKFDSTILISNQDTTYPDFDVSTSDSVGDTYLKSFKSEAQYFSDLPESCVDGFQLKITGSAESEIDDYYVRFGTDSSDTYGNGAWSEEGAPDTKHIINPKTMPHILIRQEDGTFLFKPADGLIKPENSDLPSTPFSTQHIGMINADGIEIDSSAYTTTVEFFPMEGADSGGWIAAGVPVVGDYMKIVQDNGTVKEGEIITILEENAFSFKVELDIYVNLAYFTLPISPVNWCYYGPLATSYESFRWEERIAGDDETNPLPNFIGNKINDIFFHENRLGILSGESVTLSETGQFFNFFRTTVIDLLDTAPIEVAGSSNSVNTLRHAIPFNGNLILFGDKLQFLLGSGVDGLSPRTVAMSLASSYECDPSCKPVLSGNSIFFSFERGAFGGMRELVSRGADEKDLRAYDTTSHIPSYITSAFRSIQVMPLENLVICLPKLDHKYPNKEMRTLYFYKYLDRGSERIQSAWFKYELEMDYDEDHWAIIKNIHVVGNTLYIHQGYMKRDGTSTPLTVKGAAYWKMEFTDGSVTDLHKTPPLLDNCVSYTGISPDVKTYTGVLDGESYTPSTLTITIDRIDAFFEGGFDNGFAIPTGARLQIEDGSGGYSLDTTVTAGGTAAGNKLTVSVAAMITTSAASNIIFTVTPVDVVTAEYDAVTEVTTFTLPMHGLMKTISDYKCITKYREGVSDGGTELTMTHNTGDAESWTVDIAGDDYTSTHLWFGKTTDMTYKYSNPTFKGPSSGGSVSQVSSGRYQIHSADIVYDKTNSFDVSVSVEGRGDYSYALTADITQVDVDVEGAVALSSGELRIPIHAKNDTYDMTVTSSSPYPVKLLSTEFEAQYNTRSRRLGI